MKDKTKPLKKKKGAKRITPDEAIRNKEDKIKDFRFLLFKIKDRDKIQKLVTYFKNRRIYMDSIGKNELITKDGIFFFATINNRKIMLEILWHFQGRKISLAPFGSFLDDIIIKERYFRGETRLDIEKGKISHGKAHSLFLEYENEVFEQFISGKTCKDLESNGMPYNQASALEQKYLNRKENV